MDSQDILDQAFLIVMASGIARGHYAESKGGKQVYTDSKEARKFDAVGAIYRACVELGVSPVLHSDLYLDALNRFKTHVNDHYNVWNLTCWSDRVSDDEIRDMFRRIASPLAAVHA